LDEAEPGQIPRIQNPMLRFGFIVRSDNEEENWAVASRFLD